MPKKINMEFTLEQTDNGFIVTVIDRNSYVTKKTVHLTPEGASQAILDAMTTTRMELLAIEAPPPFKVLIPGGDDENPFNL